MRSADKYVSVIFDEMAIMPSLNFNEREGIVQDFKDMGDGARCREIADHVLIFMVRGIKKNLNNLCVMIFTAYYGRTCVPREAEKNEGEACSTGAQSTVCFHTAFCQQSW